MKELQFFKAHEFACKCGKCGRGIEYMDEDFLQLLDDIRAEFGHPMHITSATRCPAYNTTIGGAVSSEHVAETTHSGKTTAVDVRITDSAQRYALLCILFDKGLRRIGLGKSFIHIGLSTKHPQDVAFNY